MTDDPLEMLKSAQAMRDRISGALIHATKIVSLLNTIILINKNPNYTVQFRVGGGDLGTAIIDANGFMKEEALRTMTNDIVKLYEEIVKLGCAGDGL